MNLSENPPKSGRSESWQLINLTFREWWGDDTFRYSASLAFYTVFSLAPILLIASGLASFFLVRETGDTIV
jgi:membrane protein